MNRLVPWGAALACLCLSHLAAYKSAQVSTRAEMQAEAQIAADAAGLVTDSLRIALGQVRAQVDTVTRTVTRRIATVDTAWLAVPESIFVQVPTVADARTACMALSASCAEAQRLFALERAAHTALTDSMRSQLMNTEQRARNAERIAAREKDRTWRRRGEGALGAILLGVGIEYLRGRP